MTFVVSLVGAMIAAIGLAIGWAAGSYRSGIVVAALGCVLVIPLGGLLLGQRGCAGGECVADIFGLIFFAPLACIGAGIAVGWTAARLIQGKDA